MRRLRVVPFFALTLVALSGCYSSGVKGQVRTNWILVGVEYDRAAAANTGLLPVFRRPSGTNFGGAARASGTLRLSDTGRATCVVHFDEPVLGSSGRFATQRYDVVNFIGVRSDDAERLTSTRGDAVDAPLGVPTELRLERITDVRLRVRPYTRDRPLPYHFVFAGDGSVERPVEIPFVD